MFNCVEKGLREILVLFLYYPPDYYYLQFMYLIIAYDGFEHHILERNIWNRSDAMELLNEYKDDGERAELFTEDEYKKKFGSLPFSISSHESGFLGDY